MRDYIPHKHTEYSNQNPSVEEYAARGLRIALVGGPKVGKNHVYDKINLMRTSANNFLLSRFRGIPRHQFRDELDLAKHLLCDTHDLPDPCDHIYVIWYFASDEWEQVDTIFVRELSALGEVIVVIAKGDLRSLHLDPATGKTKAQQLEDSIRLQFHDIPIVHCGDPTLSLTFWVPPFCKYGHDRSHFDIQPEKKMWTCMHRTERDNECPVICQDSHTGEYGPTGYDELLKVSLALIPKTCERSIQRVKYNKLKRNSKKLLLIFAVSLALVAAAVKIGTSFFPKCDDSSNVKPAKSGLLSSLERICRGG